MPRRRRSYTAAAAAIALVAACNPYVEGNGVYHEEDRTGELPSFAGLRVEDGIQATLTVGSPVRVVVSGDSNIVKSISTVVVGLEDGTPVLDVSVNLDSVTPRFQLGVAVTVPEIRYLAANGASRISASNVSTGPGLVLRAVASDGSNVKLSGPGGESLDVVLSGGTHGWSQLDARAYPVSAHTSVALTGTSRAEIDSAGPVTGTTEAGSWVENHGTGACAPTVTCAAP